MATTDIDGTPLLILGLDEVRIVDLALETEYGRDSEWGDPIDPALIAVRAKVNKWMEENS